MNESKNTLDITPDGLRFNVNKEKQNADSKLDITNNSLLFSTIDNNDQNNTELNCNVTDKYTVNVDGIYFGINNSAKSSIDKKIKSKKYNTPNVNNANDICTENRIVDNTRTLYKVTRRDESFYFIGKTFNDVYDTCECIKKVENVGSIIMLNCDNSMDHYPDVTLNSFCVNDTMYVVAKSVSLIEEYCKNIGLIITSISSLSDHLLDNE